MKTATALRPLKNFARRGNGVSAQEELLQRAQLPSGAPIPEGRRNHESLRRDAIQRRSLALADLTSACIAIGFQLVVFGAERLQPGVLLALPGIVLICKILGLYDRDEHLIRKTTLEEAPALFQMSALYALLLWLGGEFFVVGALGQAQVLALWMLLFASMLTLRTLVRAVVEHTMRQERCLVIGDATASKQLTRKFDDSLVVNASIVGRVALHDERERSRNGDRPLGTLNTLGLVLVEHNVDRVVIAPGERDSDEVLDAIRIAKALGVKVSVLPRLFEVVGSSVRFDDVDGLTLLAVPSFGLSKSSAFLKRSTDIILSGLALLLFAPTMLWIAVAIKLGSPGPVFFRQKRIGKNGIEFEMLKFRSMVDGADEQKAELLDQNEADGLFKIADDPRITRIGKLLRRTSLDELPQLINVLRGDMSLVGPRPLVSDDDQRVRGWHRRRLHLPPGMTGQWQVLGSSRIPLNEMVKIDYLYGGNWSLWLDVKILLRTIPHVLSRRGL